MKRPSPRAKRSPWARKRRRADVSPRPIRLYNTLSRQTEEVVPVDPGTLGIYVCGMTVYDHAHVGHARAMVVFDALVRWLRQAGWQVNFVRNFTDVDDKIIHRAAERGMGAVELAEHFIHDFHQDCADLQLEPPTHEPRVSTSMAHIVGMIEQLIASGHAYESGGCVWFKITSYAEYGALSGQEIGCMQASGEPDPACTKSDPRDFALWKAAKPGEPAWESPWGPGRPGWHIECSAMAREHLGVTIDIHGGGLDLVFPHHENELAQSTCANHAPYARLWMHNGLLTMARRTEEGLVHDAKMGKSTGNVVRIRAALQAYPAEALKLFYLAAHYRSPLPWTEASLDEALSMLARLYEAREVGEAMGGEGDADAVAQELGEDAVDLLTLARAFPDRFTSALDDDFATSRAVALTFELARGINRLANLKPAKKRGGPVARVAVDALQAIQGLGLLCQTSAAFQEEVKTKRLGALGIERSEVEQLLTDRTAARTAKDWSQADAIRARLDELGVVVMDHADGVEWRLRLAS